MATPENFDTVRDGDERFEDIPLDIRDASAERVDRIDDVVDAADDVDQSLFLLLEPEGPREEERARRTQEVLRKYDDVRARLEEILTDEAFATLDIAVQEHGWQLDVLPPRYDGSVTVAFELNGVPVRVEEGWTFQEDMEERPESPVATPVGAEEDASGDRQSGAYEQYVTGGKEEAQREALLRALDRAAGQVREEPLPNIGEDEPGDTQTDAPSGPDASAPPNSERDPDASVPGQTGNRLGRLIERLIDRIGATLQQRFPRLAEALGLDRVSARTLSVLREAGRDGALDDGDLRRIADAVRADPALHGLATDRRVLRVEDLLRANTSMPGLSAQQRATLERLLGRRNDGTGDTPAPAGPSGGPGVSAPSGPDVRSSPDIYVARPPDIATLHQQTELLLDQEGMGTVNRAIEGLDLSESERNSLAIQLEDTGVMETMPPFYQGTVKLSYVPDRPDGAPGKESDRVGSEVGWEYQGVRRRGRGTTDAALILEDSTDGDAIDLEGMAPGKADRVEGQRRNVAVRQALLTVIGNLNDGSTEPVRLSPLGPDIDPDAPLVGPASR